jgi:hypothetical protein
LRTRRQDKLRSQPIAQAPHGHSDDGIGFRIEARMLTRAARKWI